MIHLSAEAINSRAPYLVRQIDDGVFVFITKHGISYTVGFIPDTSFMEKGVYQFFLTKTSRKKGRQDEDISETIRVIIEEFFAQEESVMLYICDTTDGRQATRDRLFRAWFYSYIESASYTMCTDTMTIDNIRYFSSVILRNNHPMRNQVLNKFHDFIAEHNQETV